MNLKDRVVIVVGASSGMGRATAVLLANSGAKVMAAARRTDRLQALQKEIADAGGQAEVCSADVTHRDDAGRLMSTTVERFGRIDALVYATGTNIPNRSLEAIDADTWQMMLDTNLSGAFHCTHAALPTMRTQQNGLIVYLSSAAVQMPDVSGVAYQASKHGLTGLAHGTRVEEKQNGIRTTVVYPGLCDTEILTKRPTPTPREVLDLSLDPVDVAQTVAFLIGLPPRAVVPELQLLPSRL